MVSASTPAEVPFNRSSSCAFHTDLAVHPSQLPPTSRKNARQKIDYLRAVAQARSLPVFRFRRVWTPLVTVDVFSATAETVTRKRSKQTTQSDEPTRLVVGTSPHTRASALGRRIRSSFAPCDGYEWERLTVFKWQNHLTLTVSVFNPSLCYSAALGFRHSDLSAR